jgi:hypothetical protein
MRQGLCDFAQTGLKLSSVYLSLLSRMTGMNLKFSNHTLQCVVMPWNVYSLLITYQWDHLDKKPNPYNGLCSLYDLVPNYLSGLKSHVSHPLHIISAA